MQNRKIHVDKGELSIILVSMSITTAIMSVVEIYGPLTFDDLDARVYAKLLRDYPERDPKTIWLYYSPRVLVKSIKQLLKRNLIKEDNGVYSPAL